MELKLADVQSALAKLCSHYPEAGHNGDSLRQISADYFEDLTDEGVTAGQFSQAIKMARRRCKFFPKVVEILECVAEIRKNPPRQPVAGLIADESLVKTQEMMATGKRNCAIVRLMLRHGISTEDAEKMLDAEEKKPPRLRILGE